MPRKSRVLQFDLFFDQRDSGITQTPRWQTLPAQARQTLTSLILRLLLDHVDGDPIAELQEMRDDL